MLTPHFAAPRGLRRLLAPILSALLASLPVAAQTPVPFQTSYDGLVPILATAQLQSGTAGSVSLGQILYVVASGSPGATAISAPACNSTNDGHYFAVADEALNAGAYNDTVTPSGGTIDGGASEALNFNGQAIVWRCHGATANWVAFTRAFVQDSGLAPLTSLPGFSLYGNPNSSSAAPTSVPLAATGFTANAGTLYPATPIRGFVNKLRNSSLSQWYGGTTPTVTTSGGWGPEGVYIVPTGGSVSAQQGTATTYFSPPQAYWAMALVPASSVTDIVLRFPIYSQTAAQLAGQNVTCQFLLYNSLSTAVTPKLTVKRATAGQDSFGSNATDVSAVSLQTVPATQVATVAYTFAANNASGLGLSIDLDLNTAITSPNFIALGGMDCRATPNVATGLNANPPPMEVAPPAFDAAWNQAFFETSYDNGVAPATVTTNGVAELYSSASAGMGVPIYFKSRKVCDPTLTIWSPTTGASGKVRDFQNNTDVNFNTGLIGQTAAHINSTASAGTVSFFGYHWAADCRNSGA